MKNRRFPKCFIVLIVSGGLFASCTKSSLDFKAKAAMDPSAMVTSEKADMPPPASATSFSMAHAANEHLRLMNRDAVKSTLDMIFGPSVEEMTTQLISTQIAWFGGPCDPYLGDCQLSTQTQTAIVPSSNSVRESLRVRACELIAADDAAITYAASKIHPGVQPGTHDRPSSKDILFIIDLFYPGKKASNTEAEVLASVSAQAETAGFSAFESWRFTFLTQCLAPDWQVP